jgi:hypothetical protein
VHPFGVWRRRWMVAVFAAMMALLSADQNLLAPNLSAAAADFHLDEYQKDTFLWVPRVVLGCGGCMQFQGAAAAPAGAARMAAARRPRVCRGRR